MNAELRRPLVFLGVLGALISAGVVLVPRFLGFAAGQDMELVGQLKRTEIDGLSLQVSGAVTPLVSKHHVYDRISVVLDETGGTASATLDFTGVLGDTVVSSLGVERVRFVQGRGDWQPEGGFAPRLVGIVAALEARRAALQAGDSTRLRALLAHPDARAEREPALQELWAVQRREYRALAWYIRAERDEVTVTEEYRLLGLVPDRPVDQTGTRRLSLLRRGREFFFSESLM